MIAAYRLVRAEVENLQLALVGSMALDDPERWDVYRETGGISLPDGGRRRRWLPDRQRRGVPDAILHPLRDPDAAKAIAARGRESVRRRNRVAYHAWTAKSRSAYRR